MEELLKSAEPAIISASERLIELVDLVLNRSYGTPRNQATYTSAAQIRQSCADYDVRHAS